MNARDVPQEWWQEAAERIPCPLACVSLTHHFVWANTKWLAMLGYALKEIKELRWQDVTLSEHVGGDEAQVQRILKGEIDHYYLDKTYVTKSGDEINVTIYVHSFPDKGEVTHFIVTAMQHTPERLQDEMDTLKKNHEALVKRVQEMAPPEKKEPGGDSITIEIGNLARSRSGKVLVAVLGAIGAALAWLFNKLIQE